MAQQQTKKVISRLITKVRSVLTQLNTTTNTLKSKVDTSTFTTEQTRVNNVLNGKVSSSAFATEQTRVNNAMATEQTRVNAAIAAKADSGMVNTELDKKANKTLDNVENADFAAKLQAAGVNTGIFNEFKGVLASAPAGTHNDLDWYINDTDNKLYLWHSNQWNNIGGGASGALDKAALLNLLGLTSISQNQLALPSSDDSTMEFKSAGEYLGKLNATTSGAYMGVFRGGAQGYAAIRLENQVPKLFGRDASGVYNIPFADIAKKTDIPAALDKATILTKLGLTSISQNQLMGTTATDSGVWIKQVGGYHSESSFSGGAFLGIAKDDYSIMAAFKFINDVAHIRFRDKGGAMHDIPLSKVFALAGKTITPITLKATDGTTFNANLLEG